MDNPVEVSNTPSKRSTQVFFCHACNMQFPKRKLYEIHKKQQTHLMNEKAHGTKENLVNDSGAGIYVRGYPKQSNEADLVKYFSQFGKVIWVHFGHDFLLLDFTEPGAVDKTMSRHAHFFHGQRLHVRRKQMRTSKVSMNDEETNEKMLQSILTNIKPISAFDDEFLIMANILQPNVNEAFQKYNLICQDFYNFLSCRFPGIQVHPFGSTLTGLGFNNSDIDLFLSGVKRREEDEVDCLNVIKKILNRSRRFGNCYVIPGAKIPIVKCVHLVTGIRCDVNIKNMLGVCNSKLIHYYLSIDLKVKKAMMVLKYWGKCHRITGQNHLLTNYSLAMMFIFFLQQPPYNFPSVMSLQLPENKDFLNIQDSWNGGFIPNYNFYSSTLCSISIQELLEQFFKFYSEFSYPTMIICPYLGKPVPRTYFNVPKELPDYYERYRNHLSMEANSKCALKIDSSICLQDPFEHCRNTLGVITDSVLDKYVLMCKLGKNICASEEHALYRLLTERPPTVKKQEYNYQDNVLEMALRKSSNYTKYICGASNKSDDEQWFDVVINFITLVLKDFLQLVLINHPDEISPSKNCKNEGQSDIHDAKSLSFNCSGKINMWHARKATAKQLNLTTLNSTLIEREIAITNHLKEIYKNFQDTTDILSFKIRLQKKGDEVVITVTKLTAYKKSFKSFAMFFAANIPLWFELYEKDLIKASAESNKT